jgi:hypothetical protein
LGCEHSDHGFDDGALSGPRVSDERYQAGKLIVEVICCIVENSLQARPNEQLRGRLVLVVGNAEPCCPQVFEVERLALLLQMSRVEEIG